MKLVAALLGTALVITSPVLAAPSSQPEPGLIDGVRLWHLPDTPDGLKPTESWHATGSSPDGQIFVGGMDHKTNTALYRLDPGSGTLRYVGDARSASEAQHNWRVGETAEKFHTRPLWLDGTMYVATLDRSGLDAEYLSRRGFHWYGYDIAADRFADLSAAEPDGVGDVHGGLVTLAADPARHLIYGAGVPTGDLYRYDVRAGRTTKLGRPAAFDRPYVYSNRVMWVDRRGRLYFTSGNPLTGDYPASIYAHVYTYDPEKGFGERRDWALAESRALETGRCLADGRCFFADDQGRVYRFIDGDHPAWSPIGQVKTLSQGFWVWMFQVTADGTKAYVATSGWAPEVNPSALYEFDLASGETRRLCGFEQLSPELARMQIHTGYAAWDGQGRFYFASFSPGSGRNVILTQIDPARLKAALRP